MRAHIEPQVTPLNIALWLSSRRAQLAVGPAPYKPPGPGELVVRNRAVAINPADWLTQSLGDFFFPWLRYPFVLGSDVAGEVAEVGDDVTRFKVGDRVLGHAVGADKQRNSAAEGAFQEYTLLLAHLTAPLPDEMTFETAAVLPLGLSTAACGLFQRDFLALHPPRVQAEPAGRTLLVWGGATSVGSNAIQLAKAAGYDVVTTASPKNFSYVTRLGASQAFDYKSRTAVHDLIDALRGREMAGAIAIGVGSASACLDVMRASKGNRFVAMATPPVSFDRVPVESGRIRSLIPVFARMIAATSATEARARLNGVKMKFIWGSALLANEVGPMIYESFLPQALAEGRYVAAPEPLIVGQGLDQVAQALAVQKKGVSARKVVVSI